MVCKFVNYVWQDCRAAHHSVCNLTGKYLAKKLPISHYISLVFTKEYKRHIARCRGKSILYYVSCHNKDDILYHELKLNKRRKKKDEHGSCHRAFC